MTALMAFVERYPIVIPLVALLLIVGLVWLADWFAGRAEREDADRRIDLTKRRVAEHLGTGNGNNGTRPDGAALRRDPRR